MKKIFLSFIFLAFLILDAYAANKWMDGSTTFMDGDLIEFNDIDSNVNDHVLEPLNRLLINSREGMEIQYNSTTQVTVAAGSIVCSNSGGTLNEIRRNTSGTTVTWSDIDTGAEASNTTYYVYASCDADATTATFKISASSTTPSGLTSYRRLGTFYNNAAGDIATITNDNSLSQVGTFVSKSFEVTYQASTDGMVVGYSTANSSNSSMTAYTDTTSSPATAVQSAYGIWVSGGSGLIFPISFPVRKGNYYKVTTTAGSGTLYFVPLGS